jgi:hypothetical protein
MAGTPAVLVRCSFAPVVVPGVLLALSPRGDLRAVMTNEAVPAEQPGTVVDEFIRVNGGDGVCGTSLLRAKSF